MRAPSPRTSNSRRRWTTVMDDDYYKRLELARSDVIYHLRRLGYTPTEEQFASSVEELKRRSAQYRLRDCTEKPASLDEITIAILEALILQGGILAHNGDGVSCVAQMVWAQHLRAEAALLELGRLKLEQASAETDIATGQAESKGPQGA